ncbi:hypothetical protein CDL12_22596 [Handroanthus impetiginosus]|uniref:BZIP domain-containing protein n=1 Tax=Handroanthus impetiginosus TaxID=429701 RepID=A0A2G9GHT8_9LAMI|nr:hypothetical protein CDL12_22596 [Handroanthus impetiginosus]
MDNGQISDNFRMDGSLVLHHDEKEAVRSADDILVRRLKNRERQRRYRARKRQEADLKKASLVNQQPHYTQIPADFLSVPVEVDISVNVTTPDCLTRVHSRRDWKKDARRAHIHKKQEIGSIIPSSGVLRPGGSSVSFPESGFKEDLQSSLSNTPIQDNNATHRLQPSRRHWKAEARNKKGSD